MQTDTIKFEIFQLIRNTEIGGEVVRSLFPEEVPLAFETELWDFKRKPPALDERPDAEAREAHRLETHELIKDIVSFYNSYGGYIVFGVEDAGQNRVLGCNLTLDLGDISKRIKSHTGRDIQLYQNALKVGNRNVLVLLVPRRPRSEDPVKFIKPAPINKSGKTAYKKGSTYIRRLDECRPAESSAEDWAFLFSDRTFSSKIIAQEKRSFRRISRRVIRTWCSLWVGRRSCKYLDLGSLISEVL